MSRKWPSKLPLTKSIKGVHEHVLRLHLPYPRAPSAEAPAAGMTGAQDALGGNEESEQSGPVRGVKRPLSLSSRAALLQDPPRRPKV